MSFFYADIKTDELKVHGHTNSIPGQIEILDAASSNMVIIKAPDILPSNVTLILPKSNGTANALLTAADENGNLSFATASGDLTLGPGGQFTVNGISNTGTIQSSANILVTDGQSIYFRNENTGIYSADTNGNLTMFTTGGNIHFTDGSGFIGFNVGASNSYLNFSDTTGESGYGIKSNNGVMQYKGSNANNWSNIVSTLGGLTDVTLSGLANNNIITYNINDSKWHNVAVTSGYYGAFSDSTIQFNNTAASYNVMQFNTIEEAFGVSILNNSQVAVSHSGVYNIQFSAQIIKTDSGTDYINIWLNKNGIAVSNTDTSVALIGNDDKVVAAWNFVLSLAANDYIELAWQSADPDIQIYAQPKNPFSPAPAIPSVILTVTQQAFVLGGTSNFFAELLDVNTTGKSGNSLVQYNIATSKWEAVSNLTLNNGNYIKLGTNANISGSNGGNVTINAGNVDLVVSGEAHVHNNIRVTGNIFLDGNNLSNISAPVGGNLHIKASNVNILSTTETQLNGPVRLVNTLYFDGGSLANISSPSSGNLVVNSGNLDIIPTGHLNILGNAHIPYSNTRLAFGDQTTYIHSPETGNLDIRATAGNVNITANHDVVITTNSASTIRFVGPNGSSPMNLSFQGANTYLNFGSTSGSGGSGIRYDGTNVDVGSSGAWSGISNTTLNIAGRTVSLGGSNTIGFSDLTGTVLNSQLANTTITLGPNTLQLGSSYVGLDLSSSNSYNTSNLVGTITNAQLTGSITNDKLSNTTITLGNQSIELGSAGNIGLSNLSDIQLTNLTNSNTLIYNSGSSKWINTARNVFSTGLTINGTIDGVSTPSSGTQAANKEYVDTVAQGLSLKTSARVSTTTDTANLNIGTFLINGATVDGITLATGNRVLVKNQSTGVQNGIYLVLSNAGTATRVSDMATGSNAAGVFCFIQEGTQNGDCGFVCSNNTGNDVVGTNALEFVQFSSAGVIQAGTALEKIGTTLNVLRTSILPIGSIQQYAGSTAPSGWLLCNGSNVSNVTYADLRSVIGGTYGSNTGTFGLPNLQGRIPVGRSTTDAEFDFLGETGGEKTVTLTTANIPAHTHFVINSTAGGGLAPSSAAAIAASFSGGTAIDYSLRIPSSGGAVANVGLSSSNGSGGAHNNLQPYIVLNYIIYTGVYI